MRRAVRGMLPRTRLGRQQLAKLKVYAGPEHPHEAQQPAAPRRARRPGPVVKRPLARHRPSKETGTRTCRRRPSSAPRCARPPADARRRWPASGSAPGRARSPSTASLSSEYFTSATHRMVVTEPLRLTNLTEGYDVDATIDGGGVSGQAGAMRLGHRPLARSSSTPSCAPPSRRPAS